MKKILILMSMFGGGHESIARAIRDAIIDYGAGEFEVIIADTFPKIFFFSENYSALLPIIKEGFGPSDHDKVAKVVNMSVYLILRKHLKKLFKKYNPDLVISDYPLTNYAIRKAIQSFKKKIHFMIYFADATYLHQAWLSEKQADYYCAPTKEGLEIAQRSGISREKIFYSGWVLRREYYRQEKNPEIKKNLGFDNDKFLIYLSGGGDGYGEIEELVKAFLQNKFFLEKCQLVIICGVNHKLLLKMQKLQRKLSDHIFSFGYIQNVFEYKKMADVICSKAGPNDIFESILLEKPFFAHNYLWGHEKNNFDWVKKQGIGFSERNAKRMVGKIISVLKNPNCLQDKIARVKAIRDDHLEAPKILVDKIKEIIKN